MRQLPLGGIEATIGDLVEYISRGKSPKYTVHSELPVVNQRAIRWFGIQDEHLKYVHPDQFEQWTEDRFIRDGDVLWNSTGTGTIGRACLVKPANLTPPKVVDSHVTIVRPFMTAVDPRYLFAWIRGPEVQRKIEDLATGTTNQIELSRATIAGTILPLAPLNEQKRIADKLDSVLARVDACRERLERVPAILKCFRQAVLAVATSGKLTEKWREDHVVDNWQTVSVEAVASEVFDGPFGSNLKLKDYSEAGVRVIRLENIGWLNFIAEKEMFIPQEKYAALRKHTLRSKDVLFSSFIAEEVRVCLLPDDLSEQAINKADCFCVRTDPSLCLPEFLALRLACRSTFLALEQEVHGATRPRINLRQLKEFTLELPALSEQHEIVRRVEALFDYADRLEARYTAARAQVERLTPALLAKAFSGELVSQDPNDESASILLESIRAARVAAGTTTAPRPLKGSRPKTPRKAEVLMLTRKDVQGSPHLTAILKERGPLTAEALWSASQLDIDDFYDQLKDEEARGLLREKRGDASNAARMLEAA